MQPHHGFQVSRRRLSSVVALLLLALLNSVMAGCSTTSTAAHATSTATPFLSAGQLGIFMGTEVLAAAPSPGQTTTSPPLTGKLYGLRASDGTAVWSQDTSGVPASVMAGGSSLYVTVVIPSAGGPSQATLRAIRLSDGTQLWQQAESGPLLGADATAVYIASQVQGADQIVVQARRASDGQSLWSANLVGDIAGESLAPVLSGGVLYVSSLMKHPTGTQFQLTAVAASDGHTLWSIPSVSPVGAPLLLGGTLYAIVVPPPATPTAAPTPTLLALRASDGSTLWQHPFDANGQSVSPIGLVACGDAPCVALMVEPAAAGPPTATVFALNAGSGAEVWHAEIGSQVSGLASDPSAIYAASIANSQNAFPTGAVTAYGVTDGKQLWTQALTNGAAKGDFLATNGSVYLPVLAAPAPGSDLPAGALDALHAADGSMQWSFPVAGAVTVWTAAAP